jgi:hypothetical protein
MARDRKRSTPAISVGVSLRESHFPLAEREEYTTSQTAPLSGAEIEAHLLTFRAPIAFALLLNRFFASLRLVLARLASRRASTTSAAATEPIAKILLRQVELLSHHFF